MYNYEVLRKLFAELRLEKRNYRNEIAVTLTPFVTLPYPRLNNAAKRHHTQPPSINWHTLRLVSVVKVVFRCLVHVFASRTCGIW